MLVHMVMFRVKEAFAEDLAQFMDDVRALEGRVPSLRSIEIGRNIVESERAYDVGLIARFDDIAGMEAYQVHPEHVKLLDRIRPVTTSAVAVDFLAA